MPIYIAVEVARRELEARLLLGLVAAERGHDVVLGKLPHRALLAGELNGWRLPPGILHLKSIASSPKIYERYATLRSRGTRVSVQDEEHGLSVSDEYGDFGRARFPAEGLPLVDAVMAWGPVDHDWFARTYPERASRVTATGSPRIDLWRPEMISAAGPIDVEDGFILFVSSTSPFWTNPFWVNLSNQRAGRFGPGFEGDDDPREFAAFDDMAESFYYVKHLVRAIRQAARQFPHRTVVVRPHHFEVAEAWEALIGDYPNVVVRGDGAARSWVRGSSVVIQSGSTVAIEATVARRQVVTFVPEESDGRQVLGAWLSNRLGRRASSVEGLLDAVSALVKHRDVDPRLSPDQSDIQQIASRHAALDGRIAADRIVDEWERMMTPEIWGKVEFLRRTSGISERIRRPLRALRGSVRSEELSSDKGPFAMEVEHKFPSLDVDALRADAARLSAHLGRFKDVEIVQIGEREVLLRAAGR